MKDRILDFVAGEYRKTGAVPTVSQIAGAFDLSLSRFYEIFPNGLREVARLAGVPEPSERIAMTARAVSGKIAKSIPKKASAISRPSISLSQNQVYRLLGLCQLRRYGPVGRYGPIARP